MNSGNVHVWVVVVTYNAAKWIRPCIDSINNSTLKANVVIVDNASGDDTIEILRTSYPECNLILNKDNAGFGVANNQGMEYALAEGADYVVLLNQDAKLDTRCLQSLWATAEKHTSYGVLSPIFYSYEGDKLDVFLLQQIYPYDLELTSDLFFGRAKDVYDVRLMPAAMWFLRREALEEVGGFDPLFFMYGEDDDMWDRFTLRGWKAGFAPGATVYHYYPSLISYTPRKILWKEYAYNLLQLKSPQKSLLKNYIRYCLRLILGVFNYAVRLNGLKLRIALQVFGQLTGKLGTIARHRNQSRNQKGAFLRLPAPRTANTKVPA